MPILSDQTPTHTLETPYGPLVLGHHKVAYSAPHNALMVADVHLGKAASFRQLGVPVPSGTTLDNLNRLSQAIAYFQPLTVFFLGDLLHAKAAHNPDLLAQLAQWRQSHSHVHMVLIRGNHDSKAGDPPAHLNIEVVEEPHMLGGFALCHHPQLVAGGMALAGHDHPAVVLQGKGKSRVRLPCFHLQPGLLVLPSFGAFTGGYKVDPGAAKAVYPVLSPG